MASKRTKALLDAWGGRTFTLLQRSYVKKSAVAAERSGERLGLLGYMLDKKHRLRTFANLGLAFPDWSEQRVLSTGKEVFRHFGRITGDFLRSPARTHEEVLGSFETEGIEHIQAVEALGRGGVLVTGHFGNWERYAQLLVAHGRQLNVVARDANQSGIQDRVLETREATGVNVLSRNNSARQILQRLRRNELVAMLADQNSDECFVPFFGHPCGTALGPAVLHQRTKAPIFVAFAARTGPAKYRGIGFPLVDPDNTEPDPEKIVARLNSMLEGVVREYPEQWLWMHDRWKAARNRGLL